MDELKLKNNPIVRSAYGGIIIALAVSLGYALAIVPNIELVTLTLTMGGFLLGAQWGAIVGGLGFGYYSALNPFGIAPLPVFVAQVIGGCFAGLGGAMLAKIFDKKRNNFIRILSIGIAGFCITLFYDILTNIGSFLPIASRETFVPFMIGGLSFSIVHIVSNTIIFALFFPIVIGALRRTIR